MLDRRRKLEETDVSMFGLAETMIGNARSESVQEQSSAIVPADAFYPQADGAIVYQRFVINPTFLAIPEDVTVQEWEDVGRRLKQLDTSISWVVGDWAEFANKQWGWKYEDIATAYGYEQSTLMTYASIARNVSTLIRNQGLSFSHHRLVAKLEPDEQQRWLRWADEEHWTPAQLNAAMHPKPKHADSMSARDIRKQVKQIKDSLPRIDASERQGLARMFRKLADELDRD